VLAEAPDIVQFINWAKEQGPPVPRPRTDKSTNLMEFFLNRLKWNDADRADLEKSLNDPHVPLIPTVFEEDPILEDEEAED
jgi:hypothetical protein